VATWTLRAKLTWGAVPLGVALIALWLPTQLDEPGRFALQTPNDALVLLLIVAACVVFAVRPIEITSDRTVTAASAPVLAIALLYSPPVAVGSAALAAVLSQAITRARWHAAVFNVSQRVLAVSAAALVCRQLTIALDGPSYLPCALAGGAFFGVNTGLVAAMSAAQRGAPLLTTWREHLRAQWLGEAGLILAGVLLSIHVRFAPLAVPLLLPPLWLAWRVLIDAGEIRRLNASLRSALESQRRFVADASHELRTPVASLRAQLEVLREDASQPPLVAAGQALRQQLDEMSRETARMSALLADLMTLAHADGGAPLAHAEVGLEDVLLDVYREARPLAVGVDFRLTLDERAASTPLVRGDRERLRQLFLNLVTNALRFTPDGGGVELSCRVSQREALVAVRDTGTGIPAEDLPRIFDRFYRADRGRARATGLGGSGLGLSIAKWIAETHGGSISVESTLGAGSAFSVRLPLLASQFAAPARSAVRAATAVAR